MMISDGTVPVAEAKLHTLLDVSRELGATLDLHTLLQRIEQAALQVLDCARVTVFLHDRQRDELFSRLATGAEVIRFPADKGIAGECFQTGDAINIADAYADPRFNPAIDRQSGFRTQNLLTLPMRGHDGDVVGVLQLINKRGGAFTEADAHLAATLSSLTGVALQRQMLLDAYAVKQKMERDMALARRIQQSLLPKANPQIPGFDIAGWNQPADATGGDFYDFLPLPEGRLGLLLADASGHGIGPALLASVCRAIVRALATTTGQLDAILTGTNALLNQDLQPGHFITLFLGLLDAATGRLDYVSGGHGPLLYYRPADDTTRILGSTTLALGILPTVDGTPATPLHMQPRDVLILITDGFHEWANPQREDFGVDRVFDVIRRNHDRSAADMIDALYAAVRAFADPTPQDDDLTAIIVKKL